MAIVYDSGSGTFNNGASSVTVSHTIGSGSNRIIWGASFSQGSGDVVTGMTFNGVAMTLAKKQNAVTTAWLYLYYLVNPPIGANNLVVTASIAVTEFNIMGASFSGVSQTGLPDATSTNSAGSSPMTGSLTTIADNCFSVLLTRNTSGATTASTNSTEANAQSGASLFYSTAAKTPAGSQSMSATYTGGGSWGTIMASFAPFTGTTNYPITLSRGSYTLSGQSVTFRKGKAIILSVGSFVYTGFNVLLSKTGWTAENKNSATWTPQNKS